MIHKKLGNDLGQSRLAGGNSSEQHHKPFSNFYFSLEVHTRPGSDAITLVKKAYDGTAMLDGMGSSVATKANLGDHVELKLVNTDGNDALDNFA